MRGADRATLATNLKTAYQTGSSVRDLAHQHRRSYGFIHKLLTEADTPMRRRGMRPNNTAPADQ